MRHEWLVLAIVLAIGTVFGACAPRTAPTPAPPLAPTPTPISVPAPTPTRPSPLPLPSPSPAMPTLTPTATPTPSRTPTATPTAAPTPTATPTPLPEFEEGLAILSHSSYIDNFGYFHVVGEVENVGSENTELNKITVTFFDDEGKAVVTASSLTYLDILRPGQASPFEIVLISPSSVDSYKLEATGERSNRKPYTDLTIEDLRLEREEGGWGRVTGQVRNTGNQVADAIFIVGTFYDSDSGVVGASFGFAEASPLKPGRSSPFTLVLDTRVASLMDFYSLQAQATGES